MDFTKHTHTDEKPGVQEIKGHAITPEVETQDGLTTPYLPLLRDRFCRLSPLLFCSVSLTQFLS